MAARFRKSCQRKKGPLNFDITKLTLHSQLGCTGRLLSRVSNLAKPLPGCQQIQLVRLRRAGQRPSQANASGPSGIEPIKLRWRSRDWAVAELQPLKMGPSLGGLSGECFHSVKVLHKHHFILSFVVDQLVDLGL